jgi:hypothetical protein
MSKLNIYCLSLYKEDYAKIKSLGYIPVGLGNDNFNSDWIKDNSGDNISNKNKFYGEYTFHYWFWKNKLKDIEEGQWFGFCAYRRFWTNDENMYEIKSKLDFLSALPDEWKNYDVVLGNNIYMDGWTKMKIMKHGFKSFILNPKYFLEKNRNLKLHFDSFHGYGNLEKAINLLDANDQKDFRIFTENQNYYNRGNMFICKSKKIFNNYYDAVFTWLKKCEEVFGFDLDDKDYGKTRIYGFLVERFSSYWFNKYTKTKIWPIAFYNINNINTL